MLAETITRPSCTRVEIRTPKYRTQNRIPVKIRLSTQYGMCQLCDVEPVGRDAADQQRDGGRQDEQASLVDPPEHEPDLLAEARRDVVVQRPGRVDPLGVLRDQPPERADADRGHDDGERGRQARALAGVVRPDDRDQQQDRAEHRPHEPDRLRDDVDEAQPGLAELLVLHLLFGHVLPPVSGQGSWPRRPNAMRSVCPGSILGRRQSGVPGTGDGGRRSTVHNLGCGRAITSHMDTGRSIPKCPGLPSGATARLRNPNG